jgi:hypothetical protein
MLFDRGISAQGMGAVAKIKDFDSTSSTKSLRDFALRAPLEMTALLNATAPYRNITAVY